MSDISTTYEIDADDRIDAVDDAWLAFALANGADRLGLREVLGQSIWNYVRGERVRDLYRLLLDRLRLGGGPVTFPYRCDSPERRRFMLLRMEALDDGRVRFVNRVVREEARDRPSVWDDAVDRLEPLHLCSLCLRMETAAGRWEEIPTAIIEFDLFGPDNLPAPGNLPARGKGGDDSESERAPLEFIVCDECSSLVAQQSDES